MGGCRINNLREKWPRTGLTESEENRLMGVFAPVNMEVFCAAFTVRWTHIFHVIKWLIEVFSIKMCPILIKANSHEEIVTHHCALRHAVFTASDGCGEPNLEI